MSELLVVEDIDTEEEVEAKKYFTPNYWHGRKDESHDTLEEAEEYIRKKMNKSPFDTSQHYILEVKKILRTAPVADVQILTIDMDEYFDKKQLQEKETNEQ